MTVRAVNAAAAIVRSAPNPIDPTPGPAFDLPVAALLGRVCASGSDSVALRELMRRFDRLLVHVARNAGLSDSDAADVVQQTWIRLWERGHQIREPESVAAWLTATVRRESLRVAMRERRYLLCADPTDDRHPSAANPDAYCFDTDFEPAMEQAVRRLPEPHQRLIRLLMSDDCPTYLEVAERLNLPVGSIGPMRMRALRLLRDAPELAGNVGLVSRLTA